MLKKDQQQFFTYYWKNSEVTDHEQKHKHHSSNCNCLDHLYSTQFIKRGLRDGDIIYVVSNFKGRMHLLGRVVVDEISERVEDVSKAINVPVKELNPKMEHVVARKPFDRPHYKLVVPLNIVQGLRFDGPHPTLVFAEGTPDKLDRQTLRSLRKLSQESAQILDNLLRKREIAV